MNPLSQTFTDTAADYLNAGLCVLPANLTAKYPCVNSWKRYQQHLPTTMQLQSWFSIPQEGLCIVTGAVSGRLEMIDFDMQGELYEPWIEIIRSKEPNLSESLVVETSQSGGRHVIYRCESDICGSMKLAQRRIGIESSDIYIKNNREFTRIKDKEYAVRQDSKGKYVIITLIETRGEGGLFLCSPAPGYEIIQGQITNLPLITAGQRETILEAAWSLNEYIPPPVSIPQTSVLDNIRPGDDYNCRGDISSLLLSHGWQLDHASGENQRWRRPGKTRGWSATLRDPDNTFYVFSSNAAPFEPNKAYSPFTVYTLLEHGGDFSKAAMELSKQGYGQKQDIPQSDVDLSRILRGPECPEPEITQQDPGPIPESYFSIPGLVNSVIDFCLQTAPYPNRALAFCGALSLQSFLAGRKIKEPGGIRTNIYLLALASTGTGKDWPRKINANILNAINANSCLGNRFASGEGLQDVMAANLNMLFQTDEIDTMLRCINNSRESRYESIQDTLLTFYTSGDSIFPMRTKAGMTDCPFIRNPHLSIFGTATPRNYYQALSERMMTSGFFSRMLIVDVGARPLCEIAGDIDAIPEDILDTAEFWQEKTRPSSKHNLSWENPNPPAAAYQGEAGKMLFEFQRLSDRNHQKTEANNEVAKAVWSRAAENARKLALLYACSQNHQEPAITEQAAEWAIDFVNHQIRRQLYMASIYAAENNFHADCLKLKEKLRNEPGNELAHSKLLKRMKMDRDSFKRLIETLVEQGDIHIEPLDQITKKGVKYVLCG